MSRIRDAVGIAVIAIAGIGWTSAHAGETAPDRVGLPRSDIHAFYYNWYANPETDGRWDHWNHQVSLREGGGKHYSPPEDIGANYYPANGLYSSNDLEATRLHMRQMAGAGIGTVAVTWWGIGSFTDKALPVVFEAAGEEGIEVCFHLEPFPGRDAETSRKAVAYLLDKYGDHPALYRDSRRGNRPLFYVYDSYLVPAADWARLLSPTGEITIRGTKYDSVFIGLWVKEGDGAFMEEGFFDGFYTYFAVDGFTYGSTPANWLAMAKWAREHGRIFIPSVGPGYDDTRIRPWNTRNQRVRENGAYYDRMFEAALAVDPAAISITSFNEWHEGTQIEPAIPKEIEGYKYLDHETRSPQWYLERTKYWVEKRED